MTELHHILKISLLDIFPTEHFAPKLQVSLKVEWEAEPSVIRPLWNQLPVYVWEVDTLYDFKIRLKTFLFGKVYS